MERENRFRHFWDTLVLCFFLVAWPYLTKTQLNARTAWTLIGFYFLLRAADACLSRRGRAPAKATAAKGEGERRVFVDNPEAVLAIAKLTGYDFIGRIAPYLGKWISVSGRYEGVAESLGRDSLRLSILLNDGRRVNLRFAADRRQEIARLQTGQRITAVGQIPTFGATFLPENCELAA